MTSTCCRGKDVLVEVYAERPRIRLALLRGRNCRHHHHHYHHFCQNFYSDGRGRGYNRKAELLEYAKHLRASAQPDASASVTSHSSLHVKQIPLVKIVGAGSKPKISRPPTCLGKWEFLIPSFLRSMTPITTREDEGKLKHKNSTHPQLLR